MVSQVNKVVVVLTVLAIGSLSNTEHQSPQNTKSNTSVVQCPTFGHLKQQTKAEPWDIFYALHFLADFYTLVQTNENNQEGLFKSKELRDKFVSSFSATRQEENKKGKDVLIVLEEKGFSEKEVLKHTKTEAHQQVKTMFVNARVAKVDLVNQITYYIAENTIDNPLACFTQYNEKINALFESGNKKSKLF